MEIEKPEPSASAPLMDNPNQREIMTRFAALNHPDIACAYWWQGNILYSNKTEYLWKVIMSRIYHLVGLGLNSPREKDTD